MNEYDVEDENNTYNKFDDDDAVSLTALALLNNTTKKSIDNFQPYKWYGKFNFLHIQEDFDCFDALYVNKKKQIKENEYQIIYTTSHLIFFHENEGKTTPDVLCHDNNLFDKFKQVINKPSMIQRSFTNRSCEFSNNLNLLNDRYPTVGTFLAQKSLQINNENANQISNMLLKALLNLINEVNTMFATTLYLPYLIHIDRLLLLKENILKVVSPNFLHFVLSPHIAQHKVMCLLFSHPRSLVEDEKCNKQKKKKRHIKIEQMFKKNGANLILDFLHSSFVTALRIASFCDSNNGNTVTRNGFFLMGMDTCSGCNTSIWMNGTKNKTKNKNKDTNIIQNTTKIQLLMKNKSQNKEDEKERQQPFFNCQSVFGLCKSQAMYKGNVEISRMVHNYGCQHLLSVSPTIIDDSFCNATQFFNTSFIINTFSTEIECLKTFISELIKNTEVTI